MKSIQPNKLLTNRASETSLQALYEEMLTTIEDMKIASSEKKRFTGVLAKYRSMWNSYVNTLKPIYNRARQRSEINRLIESRKKQG